MKKLNLYSFVMASAALVGCRTSPAGASATVKDTIQPQSNPCQGQPEFMQSCGATWGLDPNKLYQCQHNEAVPIQACSHGCQIEPNGVPDKCLSDPTAPAFMQKLCDDEGGQIINGSPKKVQRCGDARNLYACDGKTVVLVQRCESACDSQPDHLWDLCAPSESDPCAKSNGGFDLSCGSSAGTGDLNKDVLYSCYSKVSNPFQFCAGGCERVQGGIDRCIDSCNDVAINAVKNFSGIYSPSVVNIWTRTPGRSYTVFFDSTRTWMVNFPDYHCSGTPNIREGH